MGLLRFRPWATVKATDRPGRGPAASSPRSRRRGLGQAGHQDGCDGPAPRPDTWTRARPQKPPHQAGVTRREPGTSLRCGSFTLQCPRVAQPTASARKPLVTRPTGESRGSTEARWACCPVGPLGPVGQLAPLAGWLVGPVDAVDGVTASRQPTLHQLRYCPLGSPPPDLLRHGVSGPRPSETPCLAERPRPRAGAVRGECARSAHFPPARARRP